MTFAREIIGASCLRTWTQLRQERNGPFFFKGGSGACVLSWVEIYELISQAAAAASKEEFLGIHTSSVPAFGLASFDLSADDYSMSILGLALPVGEWTTVRVSPW